MSEPATKKRRLQPFHSQPKAPPRKLSDGRTLKFERKEGDWPAHIFLEVELPPSFLEILRQAAEILNEQSGVKVNLQVKEDLHISLSRDLYLRSNQRDAIKQVGQDLARMGSSSFVLSFARFYKLVNENDSRAFLAVEVGGGHDEVLRLVHRVDDLITGSPLRLPQALRYYHPPILHASFAWSVPNDPQRSPDAKNSSATSMPKASDLWSSEAIEHLQEHLQTKLRKQTFEATHINVRFGQDKYHYAFS